MRVPDLIDSLTRLVAVAAALQSGPTTLEQLARVCGVSERTVQRDIAILIEIGATVVYDPVGYTHRIPRRWSLWRALQSLLPDTPALPAPRLPLRRCTVCRRRYPDKRHSTRCPECRPH